MGFHVGEMIQEAGIMTKGKMIMNLCGNKIGEESINGKNQQGGTG